jgi:hypothetical protein
MPIKAYLLSPASKLLSITFEASPRKLLSTMTHQLRTDRNRDSLGPSGRKRGSDQTNNNRKVLVNLVADSRISHA